MFVLNILFAVATHAFDAVLYVLSIVSRDASFDAVVHVLVFVHFLIYIYRYIFFYT